jgi:hypothetical protein
MPKQESWYVATRVVRRAVRSADRGRLADEESVSELQSKPTTQRGQGEAPHPPVRRDIDLLTTVDQGMSPDVFVTKSFGNIIELGIDGLILESSREFRVGAPLTLSVVFPGQPRGEDPFAHFRCVVRKVQDAPSLQYHLAIVELDAKSRKRLELYLTGARIWRGL